MLEFLMCSSWTWVIVMPSILLMDRWRNTSRVSRSDSRSAHVSHPWRSRLSGIALKMLTLVRKST